jgi:hypothetical protein
MSKTTKQIYYAGLKEISGNKAKFRKNHIVVYTNREKQGKKCPKCCPRECSRKGLAIIAPDRMARRQYTRKK